MAHTVKDKKEAFVAIINGQEHEVDEGHLHQLDIAKLSRHDFHLLLNGESFDVRIISIDPDEKKVAFILNGRQYLVRLKDPFDVRIEQLGLMSSKSSSEGLIRAPMPGLVLHLLAQEGDTVNRGEPLVILEAMKMENILKSDRDGVVSSVSVRRGEKVEKGQILIHLDAKE